MGKLPGPVRRKKTGCICQLKLANATKKILRTFYVTNTRQYSISAHHWPPPDLDPDDVHLPPGVHDVVDALPPHGQGVSVGGGVAPGGEVKQAATCGQKNVKLLPHLVLLIQSVPL